MVVNQATINAVDFLDYTQKEELDSFLSSLSDFDDEPDTTNSITMGMPSSSTENWGRLSSNSEYFTQIELEVKEISSLRNTYVVLLIGFVKPTHLEKISEESDSATLQPARVEIQNIWKEKLDEIPLFLSTRHEDTKIIPDTGFPITVGTVNCDFAKQSQIADQTMTLDELARAYEKYTDSTDFFSNIGIGLGHNRSLSGIFQNKTTVLGHSGAYLYNNWINHCNYTIVELSRDEPNRDMFSKQALLISEHYFLRMISMVFIIYWFRYAQIKIDKLSEGVYERSLSEIKMDTPIESVQAEMEDLLSAEMSFIDSYSEVNRRIASSRSHLELVSTWINSPERGEIGLRSKYRISSDTHEPIQTGVFEEMISEASDLIDTVETEYDRLLEMYELSSDRFNKRLSLQSTYTNLQINNTVKILTYALLFLAIVDGLGFYDWLNSILPVISGWVLTRLAAISVITALPFGIDRYTDLF
ncbi:hypothetical protein ACH9L7_01275 [Haloferax sp. S1W]|uniref:hypothetical protein n=1 Tax=Haloferax sp. S1W TaxID=3377110 RepID=UPI0037CA5FDC